MVPDLSLKKNTTRIVSEAVHAQKKFIAILISLVFVAFLLLIITLFNTLQKTNISQTTTSTKQGGVNVNLKKEYENPFSIEAQYINPFSEYKNPFDNLIQ